MISTGKIVARVDVPDELQVEVDCRSLQALAFTQQRGSGLSACCMYCTFDLPGLYAGIALQ